MFFVFNELSAKYVTLSDNIIPQNIIDDLVEFLHKLNKNNIVDEIMFPFDFFTIPIGDSYNLSMWLHDKNVNKSRVQFLKRFLDKHRQYYNSSSILSEFKININGELYDSVGGAFALERDCMMLSLSTDEIWKNEFVTGEYTTIGIEGELKSSTESAKNAWTKMDENTIVLTVKNELLEHISSGQDLWENYRRLFPNIVLCDNVKDQLYNDSEKLHIVAIIKKLGYLQEYFSSYDGVYNPKILGIGARTESDTVKNDIELRNLRRFKKPDGSVDYFFDHISFSGKYPDGRIHFLPDNDKKICYIGYIGRHLKTKNYG